MIIAKAALGRILITGGRGFMGEQFRALYPSAIVPEMDISDPLAVLRTFEEVRPEIVINCAGRTGHPNVDWCEDHRSETYQANVTGPTVLLNACLDHRAFLVHLSSGCIYEGDNGGVGFRETDVPNFRGSFYSRTKTWAEQVLAPQPALTLRLRMPFDGSHSSRNLVMKLRRYRRVLTTPNSITHVPDFLHVAAQLIERRATGVFNLVNEGHMSPFQVMERYQRILDPHHTFEPLSCEELPQVTRAGRSNCILNTDKLKALGLAMPPVEQAVETALRALAELERRIAA